MIGDMVACSWNPIMAAKHVANVMDELVCLGTRGELLRPKEKYNASKNM